MLKLAIPLVLGVCLSSVLAAKDLQLGLTTSATPLPASADALVESEVIAKRDLKAAEASSANTNGVAAKNYDPPPEYYRGSEATGHLASTQAPTFYSNFKPSNGFKARPVTFPDAHSTSNNPNIYSKYQGDGGDGDGDSGRQQGISDLHSANSYNSWQHLKGNVGALLNKNDAVQDRISVGHYTNSEHGNAASGGRAYEGRPYGGQAHHPEYLTSNSYYSGRVPTTAPATGYYGASAAAAEGVPFDVYGSKQHYSATAGNDYASYPYSDVAEPSAHKSHPDWPQKALLAKSFLIPLASAAVLGIAAALVSNPLLLQLGTVSGVAPAAAVYGKRRKRDLATAATPGGSKANNSNLNFAVTSGAENKKDSRLLPYRGHHQQQQHHRQQHTVHS